MPIQRCIVLTPRLAIHGQWDKWLDAKMPHTFSLRIIRDSASEATPPNCPPQLSAQGPPRDLIQGLATACPSAPFGGSEDLTVSRTHVAASMRPVLSVDEAWTTTRHIYLREMPPAPPPGADDVADGVAEWVDLTPDAVGYNLHPVFSHDGTRLAWLEMATAQYEADASRSPQPHAAL